MSDDSTITLSTGILHWVGDDRTVLDLFRFDSIQQVGRLHYLIFLFADY